MSDRPGRTKAVWLATGWGGAAHSVDGSCDDDRWNTKCGRPIQERVEGRIVENGVVVSWGILNHSTVKLCGTCFRADDQGETR